MRNDDYPTSGNSIEITLDDDANAAARTPPTEPGNVIYTLQKPKPSIYETLAFALLCLLAGGAVWFLWTHTAHRPVLTTEIRK